MYDEVFAVRLVMVDGSVCDLLLFKNEAEAERHAAGIRECCPDIGFERILIHKRKVLGIEKRRVIEEGEVLERRAERRPPWRVLMGSMVFALATTGCDPLTSPSGPSAVPTETRTAIVEQPPTSGPETKVPTYPGEPANTCTYPSPRPEGVLCTY